MELAQTQKIEEGVVSQSDAPSINQRESLMWAIAQVARYQATEVDRLELHAVIDAHLADIDNVATGIKDWERVLADVCSDMDIQMDEVLNKPDPARLPAVMWSEQTGWILIRNQTPRGTWLAQDYNERWIELNPDAPIRCTRLRFDVNQKGMSDMPAYQLFKDVFMAHRKPLYEAGIATMLISIIALATSMYSMQIYDRVIPTKGYGTLLVLTVGATIAMLFEFVLKFARSYISEENVIDMDTKLSREIFSRLLKVRMDQMPASLGSLSAQIRGYESIRAFMSSSTLYFFVDIPFSLIFIILISLIGSPWLALPLVLFYVIAIGMGLMQSKQILHLTKESLQGSNKKMGLLVETIEGAETIKAGGGSWNMLSRWIDLNDDSLDQEVKLREVSEHGSYWMAMFQQATYFAVVAIGAYLITEGQMTMGALIACTIMTGRITSPVQMLYQLINRYAGAKGALDGIEALYKLKMDNHDAERVVMVDNIHGNYRLEDVRFSYHTSPRSLNIPNLTIHAGEKVGILGAIGSGKSTLLRLLTGMYQPLTGKVLIDGVDISHLSRQVLSEQIGYLQQEHRLFNGSLRDNLLIGTLDPGDAVINAAAEKTGLLQMIAGHPKGLELPISEGGKGLSGGQKQLTALTRLLISNPSVWLLDEPTSSMDQQTADRCMNVLRQAIKPEHTLVLVTHTVPLLALVDRLIVVANNRIVLDGPKDEVIARLTAGSNAA